MKWQILRAKMLEYILVNRVSSTEVADAMYKTGELDPKLRSLVPGTRVAGIIYYVPAFNGSNYHVHKHVSNTPKDSVVYVDPVNCEDKAIFGALVAKYILLYRQAKGAVVGGLLRDVHQLVKEKYPIWAYGGSPIGCINEDTGFDEKYYEKRKQELDGGLLIADDSGVVVIKNDQITEQLLERLAFIEEQEDIWFDCIDRLKWDTFDTVCLKKYKSR